MNYKTINGKIQTGHCEINVVDHCNLSCRACSHLSPWLGKHFVAPEDVSRDLSVLGAYYQPERISLLGGEPLLHPQLTDVIDAVRKSGVCNRIRLVTNGLLLHRVPERLWQQIDQLQISLYPGFEPTLRELKAYQKLARKHGVALQLRHFDHFRETFSKTGTDDPTLVSRIYRTCEGAHVWRCHTLYDGYLFRCSQSVYISKAVHALHGSDGKGDGLKLDPRRGFLDELVQFLTTDQPLSSCRYCLGSAGVIFPHAQDVRRSAHPVGSTEQLIDWRRLHYLERRNQQGNLGVVQADRALAGNFLARVPYLMRKNAAFQQAVFAARRLYPHLPWNRWP